MFQSEISGELVYVKQKTVSLAKVYYIGCYTHHRSSETKCPVIGEKNVFGVWHLKIMQHLH